MPESRGFMERVFQGTLDASEIESAGAFAGRARAGTERVRLLLQEYRELLQLFSPEQIEASGRIPPDLIRRMAQEGFFGISLPVEYGGLGFDAWEYMKLIEGAALIDLSIAIVFLAHLSIGTKGIELFGNEAQKKKYLVAAASGEMIFSYALTEPKIGSDAQHIETAAVLSEDGKGYILNGQKSFITNANYAGALVTFAQMDRLRPGYMGAFIVETSWEGVKIGSDMPKMGLKASSTAPVQFRNVMVPVENLLGEPGSGFRIAMTVLNYGRLGLGASSSGIMNVSSRDMLKRARSRIQFGVPIETFPLIREKIVRTRAHHLIASAMNDFTLGLLADDPRRNVAIETSHCKLYGTTRAWDAVYDALQVAGGSGYLCTLPYEKRMRDARVTTLFEGTTEIHSIYPALLGVRSLERELRSRRGAAKFLYILKQVVSALVGARFDLRYKAKTPNRAARLAEANIRSVRRLLIFGLLHYGKDIVLQEFFLRRVSTLSMHAFAIMSVLKRLKGRQANGEATGTSDSPSLSEIADGRLLEFLIQEAKEARRENNRLFDKGIEKLNAPILKDLSSLE